MESIHIFTFPTTITDKSIAIDEKLLSLISIFPVIAAIFSPYAFANKPSSTLSKKDVISALIKNSDVLLKNSAYCNGTGTTESNQSIGDYINGFWAYHTTKTGRNWIEVTTQKLPPEKSVPQKSALKIYLAKVTIYRKEGEENWGWGVSFELDENKKVKRNSFACTGSG